MPLKPVRRNYNCTDGDLTQKATQITACVTRDQTRFNNFGVTASTVTQFSTIQLFFEDKVSDDELIADQTTATATKNTARKNLENTLRYVKGIADQIYKGEGKYRKFGFEDFSNMRDNDFIRAVRRVNRVCNDLSADIQETAPGIVDAMNDLSNEADIFDGALDAIVAARHTRDIATQDRIQAGNRVYEEMIRLCDIGKTIFQDTDEAKYNDYVLGFQGGTPGKPENAATTN